MTGPAEPSQTPGGGQSPDGDRSADGARSAGGAVPQPRSSPLGHAHASLGAKMVDFGGWSMPLAYPGGTIAEHMACRRDCAVFDVSHLGTLRVEGPQAFTRLQRELTNDLAKITPGRAQYTHLLDAEDGSVLDDIIVWWVSDERFEVMPNASNTDRVHDALGGRDVTPERVVLAIQGPRARERLGTLSAAAAATPRFACRTFTWQSAQCIVAGTGYTGEDGVECALPTEVASGFFEALVEAGVTPAGLGARDTLRLESGLPLHGHELGPGITPLQAGLGWVVAWAKGDFRGRRALEDEARSGPTRLLRGLAAAGRQPPREGALVLTEGRRAGQVTSGNFSPVLQRGIALALIDVRDPRPGGSGPSGLVDGTTVEVVLRGRSIAARVITPPFVRSGEPAPGALP